MTNEELRRTRKAVPLTQDQLAKAIGYSRKSVINWENAVHPIPEYVAIKVLEVCIGVPLLLPATAPKPLKLTINTISAYRDMRRQNISHIAIAGLWQEKNFIPTPEAQAAILAEFPDILTPNHKE